MRDKKMEKNTFKKKKEVENIIKRLEELDNSIKSSEGKNVTVVFDGSDIKEHASRKSNDMISINNNYENLKPLIKEKNQRFFIKLSLDNFLKYEDIPKVYLMNKLKEIAQSIILELIIPSKCDTENFIRLADYLMELVGSEEGIEEKYSLVIKSQDDNHKEGTMTYVFEYVKDIKNYLEKLNQGEIIPASEKSTNERIIRLLNSAIKNGESSAKISLSQKPLDADFALEKVTSQSFRAKRPNQSAPITKQLSQLRTDLGDNIAHEITKLKNTIIKNYKDMEEENNDLKDIYEKFNKLASVLTKYKNLQDIDPTKIITLLLKDMETLNVSNTQHHLRKILEYEQCMKKLSQINLGSFGTQYFGMTSLNKEFTSLLDLSEKFKRLYGLLDVLHNILSNFEVQKRRLEYQDKIMSELMIETKVKLSETRFKDFLNKLNINDGKGDLETAYDEVKDDVVEGQILKSLIKVLNETLFYKVEKNTNGDSMIVKGQYVVLSEIKKYINADISHFEIHALNTVYIDEDLDMMGKTVGIVAPVVEIVGDRRIILDGKGNDAKPKEKAASGLGASMDGQDGEPGLPGGNGGNFLLVSERVRGGRLTVSTEGGPGSRGQDGGDGGAALGGEDPPDWGKELAYRGEEHQSRYMDTVWRYNGFKTVCGRSRTTRVAEGECQVYGKLAKAGGRGGNGGAGGRGGSGGSTLLLDLSSSGLVSASSRQGADGPAGRGGLGGQGAPNGKWGTRRLIQSRANNRFYYFYSDLHDFGVSDTGPNGTDGKNLLGITKPQPTSFQNPSYIINNFKYYSRENLSKNFNKKTLMNFMENMNNHRSIQGIYDTLGLINEIQGMEEQYFKLHKELDMLPFYQSLMKRIEIYVQEPKETDESKKLLSEYKKVLSYLYSATLSKICAINNKSKNDFIIDVPQFFKITLRNIDKLKEVASGQEKLEYFREYSREIESEKDKVKATLELNVIPEIDNIGKELENGLESVIEETKRRLMDMKMDLKAKDEHKKKALRKTWFTGLAKTANALGLALSLFGGAAVQVAGASLSGLAEIGEIILDRRAQVKARNRRIVKEVTPFMRKVRDALNSETMNRFTNLSKQIKQLQENPNLKNNTQIQERLSKAGEKLLKMEINAKIERQEVDKINEDLQKDFKEQEAILKAKNQTTTYLEYAANTIELSAFVTDSLLTLLDDVEMADIKKDISNAKRDIFSLERFQNLIYTSIVPSLKGLETFVKGVMNDSTEKLHVHLDVSKWQVQNSIKEVQYEIKRIAKVFDLQDEMMRGYEKLDSTMSVILNLHDRMVSLGEKSRLASYIAEMHSNKALAIKLSNPQLNEAVNSLQLMIHSNLVLDQYNRAMEVFGQYVFPFAGVYMEKYSLPATLTLASLEEGLIPTVIGQIEEINSKILEEKITVGKYEKYMHRNVLFNSDYPQLEPFTIWKNEGNRETIEKLLRGEEIEINAQVTQGVNGNAVKFNEIGIDLKINKNKSAQEELNDILEYFKITMTHGGNSHFKCGDQIFKVTTEELAFSYYLKKDKNGKPIITNGVYDKIAHHESLLSPYTMWKIKLSNVTKDTNFNSLEKFKTESIDLELVGRGQYIEENENEICNNKLGDYYKEDYGWTKFNEKSFMLTSEPEEIRLNEKQPEKPQKKQSWLSRLWHSLFGPKQTSLNTNSNIFLPETAITKNITNDYAISTPNLNENYSQEKFLSDIQDINGSLYSNSNGTFLGNENLLLWDVVLRKLQNSKEKKMSQRSKIYKVEDNYESQDLAYSYYVNKDE